MKRVDFYISNSNHHWQMMKPVMLELQNRSAIAVRLVSLCELRRMDTPEEELTSLKIPFIRLASLKFKGTTTSTGKKHIGGNRSPIRNFLRWLVWLIKVRPRLRAANADRPDYVVVPNDVAFPFDRICKWFNRNSIPFFLFQEGIRFPLPNEGAFNYGKNGAKYILAWGKDSEQYFKSLALPKTKIVCAGNPRFDELASRDYTVNLASLRSEIRLGKYNLLYVSNPVDDQGFCSHEEKLGYFRSFLAGVKGLMNEHDLRVLVRLHPREDMNAFKAVVEGSFFEDKVFFVNRDPLFACLKVVDLCVILASTVGVESSLVNTPVAVIKLGKHGYAFNYVSSGCAIGLDLEKPIHDQIWSAITADNQRLRQKCEKYIEGVLANRNTSARFIANYIAQTLQD